MRRRAALASGLPGGDRHGDGVCVHRQHHRAALGVAARLWGLHSSPWAVLIMALAMLAVSELINARRLGRRTGDASARPGRRGRSRRGASGPRKGAKKTGGAPSTSGFKASKTLRFFRCKGKDLRAPEILRDFRRSHQQERSRHQYAYWWCDPAPGVHAAGSD